MVDNIHVLLCILLCWKSLCVQGYTINVAPSNYFIVETQATDLVVANIGSTDVPMSAVDQSLNCRVKSTKFTTSNGQTTSNSFGSPFSVGTINANLNGQGVFNLLGTTVVFNAESPFKLDASIVGKYEVIVTCEDQSNVVESNAATEPSVVIHVFNNAKPSFIQPFVTKTVDVGLEVAAVSNALVYNVSANVQNDQLTDVLSFTVRSTDPQVDYFDLNPATGILSNKVDLRTATQSPIVLTVDVNDGYNSADRPLTLTIDLLNMNQRPDITGLPATINIDEDTQTLNVVDLSVQDDGVLVATQPVCTISPTSGQEVFDLVTRPISLKPRGNQFGRTFLDYETTTKYTISCSVSDGYLTSQGEVLEVVVNNINEPPVFSDTLFYCTMDESKPGVSACNLGFNIRDPEGNQFVTRLFQDENSNRFALTSTSNNVNNNFFGENDRLTFNVDYDVDEGRMPDRVTLFVNAVDEFGRTGTATVSVIVRDVNDNAPEFNLINTAIEIDYSTPTGLLGVIKATDEDSGTNGEIDYRLDNVVPPNAINYVSILGNGDIQYIRQYPDSLAGSSVYLSVEAKDRGSPTRSSTGTVVVSLIRTTTTSTTTTTTTTASPTTITITTTTEETFFDKSENIAIFAILMVLLLLALLVGLYFLFKWCITGNCCGGSSGGASGGRGGMCDNCCQPQPRRVTPVIYEDFDVPPVTSGDYKGDFWRSGDYYEHGRPY